MNLHSKPADLSLFMLLSRDLKRFSDAYGIEEVDV